MADAAPARGRGAAAPGGRGAAAPAPGGGAEAENAALRAQSPQNRECGSQGRERGPQSRECGSPIFALKVDV